MASKGAAASTESSNIPPKWTIKKRTVQNWDSDYDKEYIMLAWLKFESK